MVTDDELAQRLKIGDEQALNMLYERHGKALLRHLSNLMGNDQEAEDILHESFMIMIKKISFYEPRSELTASFKTWFFRLATNRAIDEIRKRKKGIKEEEAIQPPEDETYEKKEQEVTMKALVEKLPPLQRTVLGLRVHEDLSYLEIAAICGKDVNSIKQSLFQARKSLKAILMEEGEFYEAP